MPWFPTSTTLGPVDERDSFTFSISYQDALGGSFPVSITPVTPVSGVTVTGNTISGIYEDVFDQTIKYRNKDDTFTDVQKWNEIDIIRLYGVYHFIQDPRDYIDFAFIASADSATRTYNVRVNNSLDYDKRQLARYVNPSGIIVTWANTSGQTVTWTNNTNNEITWTT